MTVRFGRYSVRINPVHKKNVRNITNSEVEEIRVSLDSLAEILSEGSEWVLVGGLPIPLTIGRFYRVHNDVDIGVSQEGFGDLIESASSHRYGLFSRRFMTKISSNKKVDIYTRVSVEEAVKKKSKHLKLLRLDSGGRKPTSNPNLTSDVDVYVYNTEGNDIVTWDGIKVPSQRSIGKSYELPSGQRISLRNLNHIRRLKERSHRSLDRYDIKVISNFEETLTATE